MLFVLHNFRRLCKPSGPRRNNRMNLPIFGNIYGGWQESGRKEEATQRGQMSNTKARTSSDARRCARRANELSDDAARAQTHIKKNTPQPQERVPARPHPSRLLLVLLKELSAANCQWCVKQGQLSGLNLKLKWSGKESVWSNRRDYERQGEEEVLFEHTVKCFLLPSSCFWLSNMINITGRSYERLVQKSINLSYFIFLWNQNRLLTPRPLLNMKQHPTRTLQIISMCGAGF